MPVAPQSMPVHVKGPCGRRPCAFWTEPRSIWQLRLPFVKTLHSADEDEVWMVGKRTQKLVPIPGMLQATLRPNKVCCNAAISACDKGTEREIALYLLSIMPAAHVLPSLISFSLCMSACEKVEMSAPATKHGCYLQRLNNSRTLAGRRGACGCRHTSRSLAGAQKTRCTLEPR